VTPPAPSAAPGEDLLPVWDHQQPGTSALFMMIQHVTPDKAITALERYGGTVIRTSLADEDAKKLRDALHPPSTAAGS
jgi:uncharacterized membrane protein